MRGRGESIAESTGWPPDSRSSRRLPNSNPSDAALGRLETAAMLAELPLQRAGRRAGPASRASPASCTSLGVLPSATPGCMRGGRPPRTARRWRRWAAAGARCVTPGRPRPTRRIAVEAHVHAVVGAAAGGDVRGDGRLVGMRPGEESLSGEIAQQPPWTAHCSRRRRRAAPRGSTTSRRSPARSPMPSAR